MKNSNWHGGKGSGRRGSDDSKYADNWDKIFGKKKEKIEWPERTNVNNRGKNDKQK